LAAAVRDEVGTSVLEIPTLHHRNHKELPVTFVAAPAIPPQQGNPRLCRQQCAESFQSSPHLSQRQIFAVSSSAAPLGSATADLIGLDTRSYLPTPRVIARCLMVLVTSVLLSWTPRVARSPWSLPTVP
jgi:hypothetical protein